tara:strand:+ start:828 stop:1079 length:252 start_codon:yes stop_codon:yes gene_type:complete
MATLVITYPDEHKDRIVDAICEKFGHDDLEEEEAMSKEDFVRMQIANWVKGHVIAREHRLASKSILKEIESDVMSVDIGVGEE